MDGERLLKAGYGRSTRGEDDLSANGHLGSHVIRLHSDIISSQQPVTNDSQQPVTNDSQQLYRNDSQQFDRNDSQQPNANDSQQPNTNDSQQLYTNDSQQPYTNESQQPYTNDSQQFYTNDSQQPYTNDSQQFYTNDSQQFYTNDSQQFYTNDSQQPYTNDSQQPYTNDSQHPYTNDNQQPDSNDSPHHDTGSIQVNLKVKSGTASSSTSHITTLPDPTPDTYPDPTPDTLPDPARDTLPDPTPDTLPDPARDRYPETLYNSSTCLELLPDPHKYLVRKTNSWPDKDAENIAKIREDEQLLSHAESVCLGISDNFRTLMEGSSTIAPDSERLANLTANFTSRHTISVADVLKPFTSINQLVCCSFLSIFCCCYFGAVAFRNAREAKLSSRHGFPELARKEIRVASNNLALAIFVGGCGAFVVCLVVLMMFGFHLQLY